MSIVSTTNGRKSKLPCMPRNRAGSECCAAVHRFGIRFHALFRMKPSNFGSLRLLKPHPILPWMKSYFSYVFVKHFCTIDALDEMLGIPETSLRDIDHRCWPPTVSTPPGSDLRMTRTTWGWFMIVVYYNHSALWNNILWYPLRSWFYSSHWK